MAAQSPKTFFPTAEALVNADLERRGRVLLILLKSYEGLGGVHQQPGGFNRDYFFADMEGVNKYLGMPPRGPDYDTEQSKASMAFREAWGWLEKESCLIQTPGHSASDWFSITPAGEKLWAKAIRFEQWEKDGLESVRNRLRTDPLGKIGEMADHPSLAKPQSANETITKNSPNPKAFVSYSWDSQEHRLWVQDLASRLRRDGVETILDQWHLRPGYDKFAFMERAINEADFVLIICSTIYAEKANRRDGGVGYEATIITPSLAGEVTQTKFIPLLREATWDRAVPHWLKGRIGFDLSGAKYDEAQYQRLLDHLHGMPPAPPPISARQQSLAESANSTPFRRASATTAPLITGKPMSLHSSTPPQEPILCPMGLGSLMLGSALIQTIAIENKQLATQNSAVATEVKVMFKHAGLKSSFLMNPGIWLPRESDSDRAPSASTDIGNECRANIAYLAQDEANEPSFIWWHQNCIAMGTAPEIGNWRAVVSVTARNCKCVRFRIAFRITAERRLADQQLLHEHVSFSDWLNFRNAGQEIDLQNLTLSLTGEQLLYDIATGCFLYVGSNDRPAIVMPPPGNPQPRTEGQVDMAVVEELSQKGILQALSGNDMLSERGIAYYDNFLKFPV